MATLQFSEEKIKAIKDATRRVLVNLDDTQNFLRELKKNLTLPMGVSIEFPECGIETTERWGGFYLRKGDDTKPFCIRVRKKDYLKWRTT